MTNFWLIILGSILAIAGGFTGDLFRAWLMQKKGKRWIKIQLKDTTNYSKEVIKRIIEFYNASNTVYVNHVMELTNIRTTYERTKDSLPLIKNEDLRKDIFDFFNKLFIIGFSFTYLLSIRTDDPLYEYSKKEIAKQIKELEKIQSLSERISDKLEKL